MAGKHVDHISMWKLLCLSLFFCSLQCVLARKDLEKAMQQEPNDGFLYNHTFAQILGEYASVVYINDLDSLIAWNCSRCNNLTKGFQLVELIVDVQHCLQAYVGMAEDLNAIVIAFRGTQENSIQNWMEDLYFRQLDLNYPGVTGAMVHRGFYTAYHNTTLRPRVIAAVMTIQQEFDGLNIFVTGHSMGGAMAAFCSLDLVANYGMKGIQTVTFGQPRIGNSIFAEYYTNLVPQTYRMTHAHDMVPHLPPYYSLFPQRSYHHFGREIWIHKVDVGSLSYEEERVCDGTGEDPTCSRRGATYLARCTVWRRTFARPRLGQQSSPPARSVSGNSISDHLCYMGIFLQADSWGSCSFILRSNVHAAETTADGFVIRLPLTLKSTVDNQDSENLQLL